MKHTDKSDPFFDIDSYINNLEKTIQSLKKEIKEQKTEIGILREEREFLLNKNKIPTFGYEPLIENGK
jgi:hypothetical protein